MSRRDPTLDTVRCLRMLLNDQTAQVQGWALLGLIGSLAKSVAPTPLDRALTRRLQRTAERQLERIKLMADYRPDPPAPATTTTRRSGQRRRLTTTEA